mgnify:CR=1 FL=1
MSGAISASTLLAATAITAAASVGASVYSGRKQQKQARAAAEQAQQNADRQVKAAEEATNKAEQKSVNAAASRDEAALAGKAGVSGTMLTGPQGVDPSQLMLGKNTLLGS